ncbi:MAG: hypothetical protein WAL93_15520, partial [Desulfobacterales bacterium]
IPKKLEFKVTIPKDSDTIKVRYETDNIKQAMVIQDRLSELLPGKYNNIVTYYKKEYDTKIELENNNILELTNSISKKKNDISSIKIDNKTKLNQINNNIAVLISEKKSRKDQIKNLNQRISDIEAEIGRINKNTDSLIEERSKFLSSNKNEDNILSSIIYSNTIQQNIGYLNSLKSSISDSNHQIYQETMRIEEVTGKIKDLQNEKEKLIKQIQYKVKEIESDIKDLEAKKNLGFEQIKNLQFKKDNIQNIQILQPPTPSSYPVRPKKKLNVILALVAGLFLMLFLAFFLEYLGKFKKSK